MTEEIGRLPAIGDQEYLYCLAEGFETAARLGADVDSLEGARWIRVSDTLATVMAERLRAIAARMEAGGIG